MDKPFTQKKPVQFRGPTSSDDYNLKIEQEYNDLVVLYNRSREMNANHEEFRRTTLRNILEMGKVIQNLSDRIESLELQSDDFRLLPVTSGVVDVERFNGTAYEIVNSLECTVDLVHGLVTLPKVETASFSKLYFTNENSFDVIPPSLEMVVTQVDGSSDSGFAIVDTSAPQNAILRTPGKIWERNVLVDTPGAPAECYLYTKIPIDLFTTDKTNALVIHPYPVFGLDIEEIHVTTNASPLLKESDGYSPLNNVGLYSGETAAVGWVPPGGWPGDIDINAGPKIYYFEPSPITAVRIKLRQNTAYREVNKYVYSYGLSLFDIRTDKFLNTGKTIFKLEAKDGETISSIDSVQPQIWNTVPSLLDEVFTYRTIWETSFESGVYTSNPVPLSKRVWIEVTLTNPYNSGTPSLSGIVVSHS